MQEFQTILVAADFSVSSHNAFVVACSIARANKTRLLLLNVVEPLYHGPETVYFSDQTVPFTRVERESSYYDSMKEQMQRYYATSQSLEIEYHTRDGDPATEIIRMAQEVGCQLIVMGTHGRTGLDRLLTGSVAEQVIRRSPCPVLAFRSQPLGPRLDSDGSASEPSINTKPSGPSQVPSHQGIREASGKPPIRLVLHPTDFSETSDAALRVACALAREQNAPLRILHVIATESVPIQVPPMPIDQESHRKALHERQILAEGFEAELAVETKMRVGNPVEEILRAAGEAEGALIVMGTHGRRGLGRLLMGSVAEAILRRSACPVLTVKVPQHDLNSDPGEPSIREATSQ